VLSAWLVPLPPSGFFVLLAGFEPAPPSYLGLSAVMVGKRLSHRSSVNRAQGANYGNWENTFFLVRGVR
jgi:hypothetical protein